MREQKPLQSGWWEARERNQGVKCQLGRDPVNNGKRYQTVTKHFSGQHLLAIEHRPTEIEQSRSSYMPDPHVFRSLQRVNVETQIPYFKVFKCYKSSKQT